MFFFSDDIDLNTFLKENSLWIALVFLGIIVIVLIILLIINFAKHDGKTKSNVSGALVITALGSGDNIVSTSCNGSRISIVLKDYSLIDEKTLKENGVISIIKMENKIILVVSKKTSEIYKIIKKE